MRKSQINIISIFLLMLWLYPSVAFTQAVNGIRKPATEVTIDGKWYIILNKKTKRARKALCNLRFNRFVFCQHPDKSYPLLPEYIVDTNQICQCNATSITNRMKIRVQTEQLHLLALNTPISKVNVTSNSIRLNLKKSGAITIPSNYKGKSFTTIRHYFQLDTTNSDSSNKKLSSSNVSTITFLNNTQFIPSRGFITLDSAIITLKQNEKLNISITGIKRKKHTYNKDIILYRARSQALLRYMYKAGISTTRITIVPLLAPILNSTILKTKSFSNNIILLAIQ